MRIGVMLRHYDQHGGGLKVHTRSLLPRLLRVGADHDFVLMYRNPELIGTYGEYPNVQEVASTVPGSVTWDQIAVPWLERKNPVDVIFNPKFTVPFLSRAKKVFVLHGSEWFVIPEAYRWYDRMYNKAAMPAYCKHADALITPTRKGKEDAIKFTGVEPSKVHPVHHGYDQERFRVINDERRLNEVETKYDLPSKFIFWLGQIYPPKNISRLFKAFGSLADQIEHDLVVAGAQRWGASQDIELLDQMGVSERVHLLGWVPDEDLPALYNLAEVFAFPSLYEGFGLPLLEAMACGCPVVTSKTGAPSEVVADAGLLVDPYDVDDIAEGIMEFVSDEERQREMRTRGLNRVESFDWEKCARETLEVIERAGARTAG